ncbi:MAG: PrsW family intramembrane metalloprotease [Firmicutes bacterium]|nr:PrsW family intramembrane metalloprotease [Bacillota bacterium]MBR5489080.1 PrsW family intramembrane metalloprotease [Bacillota bacterium]
MTYIENIMVCIAVPLLLSLLFIKGNQRKFIIFLCLGMGICMISAYVNSFFMMFYQVDSVTVAIEISPVCEELLKMVPLLLYILIFEPEPKEITPAAIAIAAGFATFENVCYLSENGAGDFTFLLIRGLSAGAIHILCGIAVGLGIAYVFRQRWLAVTGTVGILGACIVFHALYNLLVTADGMWQTIGHLFPSVLIIVIFVLRLMLPRVDIKLD